MRTIRSTVLLLFAIAATGACDGDRVVSPASAASAGAAHADATGTASCQKVRGTGTVVLDPATGELVGSLSGDLTGTHRGAAIDATQHGNGASTITSQATFVTDQFGTLSLTETVVAAPVSPTLIDVNSRSSIAPGGDVTGGFLIIHGYLDVSGLPQGGFDYHGQICT